MKIKLRIEKKKIGKATLKGWTKSNIALLFNKRRGWKRNPGRSSKSIKEKSIGKTYQIFDGNSGLNLKMLSTWK